MPDGVTTNDPDHMKIGFATEAQLSRIEIDHDFAE
jgi:hypothetical protein